MENTVMIENSHIRLVSPIGSLYREEGEGEEGREIRQLSIYILPQQE